MLRGCRHLACCNKLWEMPSFCPTSSTIACWYGWFYQQMMEKCSWWYVSSRHWQFRFFLISSHQKIGLDDQIGTYLFFSNVWSVHLSFLLLTLSLSSHWDDPTLIFSSGTCHGLVSRGRVKISSTSSSSQSFVSLDANETGDHKLASYVERHCFWDEPHQYASIYSQRVTSIWFKIQNVSNINSVCIYSVLLNSTDREFMTNIDKSSSLHHLKKQQSWYPSQPSVW